MLGMIQAGLSIAGGLKGLFGKPKEPKQPDIRKNMIEQAQGARLAAAQQGFNPLTMLQYGQPGGAGFVSGGGEAPVLASIDAITSGLAGVDDIVSGDAARRRQADELELDLARVKLDQARSGVAIASPRQAVASGVGSGTSPLGTRPQTVAQSNTRPATASGFGPKPAWATGRTLDVAPVTNSPGVFEMQNPVTGGKPITIPGEGEPWGIDELATAVVVGAPQVAYNAIQDARAENARMSELRESDPAAYEKERFDRQQRANKRAPKDANSRSWNQTFQLPGVSN